MTSTVSNKRKSSGSLKLRPQDSRRSSSKSKRSERSDETSSKDVSLSDDDVPIKYLNMREELTLLFFHSMLEDIVEIRQMLPYEDMPKDSYDTLSTNVFLRDFKEIQESDLKCSTASLHPSKLFLRSSSAHSKKYKPSKQSTIKEEGYYPEAYAAYESTDCFGWILKFKDKNEEITFKNGNVYVGQTSKSIMHGTGTFYWADGTVYKGHFKDGYPDGSGQMVLPDLSVYEGDFFRGYFHGKGVFRITSTPMIYSGFWKHGKKHGKGWLLYEVNNWYEGNWSGDKKNGFGYRRYKKGGKYKGEWSEDEKNGEGSMIWENNDYYVGEWMGNLPHGYGEYTWNIHPSKSFVFPFYNSYKGSWVEGQRTGAGVMDFGTHSGAKLAGIWLNNLKHGPGVIICGNGLTLQSNPLFEHDKPAHMRTVSAEILESMGDDSAEASRGTVVVIDKSGIQSSKSVGESQENAVKEKNSYRRILKEINSKVALKTFDSEILTNITKSGFNISESRFVKLDDSLPGIKCKCPLEVPIHTVAEDVDLNYYIDIIFKYYFESPKQPPTAQRYLRHASTAMMPEKNFSLKEIQSRIDRKKSSYLTTIPAGRQKSSLKITASDIQHFKKNEERLLRHLITVYLPQLTELYDQYATFTRNGEINFKPVLIRLFLWQLLRDIGLPRQGVPLIEADLFLADNPSSCVESIHYPFEPIYFWQFLQAVFGCCWLLFLSTKEPKFETFSDGIVAQIFKQFLETNVLPNAGKFEGLSLTEYKDLLPIKYVYQLYLQIGEPHTVGDFLFYSYVKKNKNPPCSAALDTEKAKNISKGNNAVSLGYKIMYLEAKEIITAPQTNDPTQEETADVFSSSLYTFRNLGKRKIVSCLIKICPKIWSEDGNINMNYKLTFLEFYEAILLCAYEKAERKRWIEEKRRQKEYRLLKEAEAVAVEDKSTKKKKPKK